MLPPDGPRHISLYLPFTLLPIKISNQFKTKNVNVNFNNYTFYFTDDISSLSCVPYDKIRNDYMYYVRDNCKCASILTFISWPCRPTASTDCCTTLWLIVFQCHSLLWTFPTASGLQWFILCALQEKPKCGPWTSEETGLIHHQPPPSAPLCPGHQTHLGPHSSLRESSG